MGFVWREEAKGYVEMRLFVGVPLPKNIKDELFSVQKMFKGDVAKIKLVNKKNLHLTLKFFGNVEEKYLGEIINRLKRIKFKSFEANLAHFGDFSRSKHSKVLWVGLSPENKVVNLQQKIDSEFLDLFSEDMKFRSHLTLGRVKFIKKSEKFSEIVESVGVDSKSFLIDSFCLIESKLTKDGPIYNILETFKPSNL